MRPPANRTPLLWSHGNQTFTVRWAEAFKVLALDVVEENADAWHEARTMDKLCYYDTGINLAFLFVVVAVARILLVEGNVVFRVLP
jgi:hypothetical protein